LRPAGPQLVSGGLPAVRGGSAQKAAAQQQLSCPLNP